MLGVGRVDRRSDANVIYRSMDQKIFPHSVLPLVTESLVEAEIPFHFRRLWRWLMRVAVPDRSQQTSVRTAIWQRGAMLKQVMLEGDARKRLTGCVEIDGT
jgi:hypothetical protein